MLRVLISEGEELKNTFTKHIESGIYTEDEDSVLEWTKDCIEFIKVNFKYEAKNEPYKDIRPTNVGYMNLELFQRWIDTLNWINGTGEEPESLLLKMNQNIFKK